MDFTKIKNAHLTVFELINENTTAYIKHGEQYTNYIVVSVISETDEYYTVIGTRLPKEGLDRLTTQKLLISAQMPLPIRIKKSDFRKVEI